MIKLSEYKVLCHGTAHRLNTLIKDEVDNGFEPISIGVGLAGNVLQVGAIGERDFDELFKTRVCVLLKKE